jgi:hypothetical protein
LHSKNKLIYINGLTLKLCQFINYSLPFPPCSVQGVRDLCKKSIIYLLNTFSVCSVKLPRLVNGFKAYVRVGIVDMLSQFDDTPLALFKPCCCIISETAV